MVNQSINYFLKWPKWHSHCKDHWLGEVSKLNQDMIGEIKKRFKSRRKVDSEFAATTSVGSHRLCQVTWICWHVCLWPPTCTCRNSKCIKLQRMPFVTLHPVLWCCVHTGCQWNSFHLRFFALCTRNWAISRAHRERFKSAKNPQWMLYVCATCTTFVLCLQWLLRQPEGQPFRTVVQTNPARIMNLATAPNKVLNVIFVVSHMTYHGSWIFPSIYWCDTRAISARSSVLLQRSRKLLEMGGLLFLLTSWMPSWKPANTFKPLKACWWFALLRYFHVHPDTSK